MVKELQLQVKNANERMDLLRKEISLVKNQAAEDNNKCITNFNQKLKTEFVTLAEQLEDVRGEVTESIKQRKRERADLMNEMSHVAQRIDKGKEQYESINQLI
jgi:uncharacterized phage infection (PIP) family protein YhgE